MRISAHHPARQRALRWFRAAGASLALLFGTAAPSLAASPKTTLISVNSAGGQTYGPSYLPSVSADGRFVAFRSDTLVDSNAAGSFVRDRKTDSTRLVASGGYQPSISADGRFVAYSDYQDVFVEDLKNGATRLVSQDRAGQPGGGYSANPSISGDGRFVAFSSDATNLAPQKPKAYRNEFVRDMKTGKIQQVNVNSAGKPGNGPCHHPSISGDGRYVAFESNASNLVSSINKKRWRVFVRDLKKHKTTLASVSSAGGTPNGASHNPSMSGDGRNVAFESKASNLVKHDTNRTWDVFRRDLKTQKTRRVSVSSAETQANAPSRYSALSNHGGFIAFYSEATNLVKRDTNHIPDIYVRNEHSGKTVRTDVSSSGQQANRPTPVFWEAPAISADGRFVAFTSLADSLVPGDTNLSADIFMRGPLH